MRNQVAWLLPIVLFTVSIGNARVIYDNYSYTGEYQYPTIGSTNAQSEIRNATHTEPIAKIFIRTYWQKNGSEDDEQSKFPNDLFTCEQLRQGAVVLHFFGALYSFAMIGIVCSNYFLPSVDCICLGLNLSQDVAAATFMSFATTAPELFTVLIGTFITESDIGLGAVIGSGMFNILGVATFGGLAASKSIQLEWWPLLRDSTIYIISLIVLFVVIQNKMITIINSSFLFGCYFIYLILMLWNQHLRKLTKLCINTLNRKKHRKKLRRTIDDTIKQTIQPIVIITTEAPSLTTIKDTEVDINSTNRDEVDIGSYEDDSSYKAYFINYDRRSLSRKSMRSERRSFDIKSSKGPETSESDIKKNVTEEANINLQACVEDNVIGSCKDDNLMTWNQLHNGHKKSITSIKNEQEQRTENLEKGCDEIKEHFEGINVKSMPRNSFWETLVWIILWPASFLLYFTIPDCREEKWRKYYSLTFIMCVFWIGVTSYFGNWMIEVIGVTFGIPDSVLGLTFLAAGGSMPEIISTIIMARQGEGGLGFSNSLGGNTMDICLCLGLPWLLKCLISGPIEIKSDSLQYNCIALFAGIFILLTVSAYTKFNMNRNMGLICCVCYLIFTMVSVLLELKIIPSLEIFK